MPQIGPPIGKRPVTMRPGGFAPAARPVGPGLAPRPAWNPGRQLPYTPGPALGAMINRIPAPQMQRNWFGAGPARRPLGPREVAGGIGDLVGALYGQAKRPVNAWLANEAQRNRWAAVQQQLAQAGVKQHSGDIAWAALQAQKRRMPRT